MIIINTNNKNLYEILGVSAEADTTKIRKAYLEMSRSTHPDKTKDKNSADAFRAVNEAYITLSDPQKRAEYDRELNKTKSSLGMINATLKKEREYLSTLEKTIDNSPDFIIQSCLSSQMANMDHIKTEIFNTVFNNDISSSNFRAYEDVDNFVKSFSDLPTSLKKDRENFKNSVEKKVIHLNSRIEDYSKHQNNMSQFFEAENKIIRELKSRGNQLIEGFLKNGIYPALIDSKLELKTLFNDVIKTQIDANPNLKNVLTLRSNFRKETDITNEFMSMMNVLKKKDQYNIFFDTDRSIDKTMAELIKNLESTLDFVKESLISNKKTQEIDIDRVKFQIINNDKAKIFDLSNLKKGIKEIGLSNVSKVNIYLPRNGVLPAKPDIVLENDQSRQFLDRLMYLNNKFNSNASKLENIKTIEDGNIALGADGNALTIGDNIKNKMINLIKDPKNELSNFNKKITDKIEKGLEVGNVDKLSKRISKLEGKSAGN